MNEGRALMVTHAFVSLTADGGPGNDWAAMASSRAPRPARPMLRTVVRMAAVAALPVLCLWKNQLAPGNVATTMTGDDFNEMSTEDPKFRFWPNNRGDNLSKRVKNPTGTGENETLELCPRRRGKLPSYQGCSMMMKAEGDTPRPVPARPTGVRCA